MSANPFASDWLGNSRAEHRRAPAGGSSYVAGDTNDPLKIITVSALLERAAHWHGGRDAAIFAADGIRLSWNELRVRADTVAAGLLALGVGRGDRVGIWAPNCLEWLLVQFGTARIGAVLVNINPAYRTEELRHALARTGCRVLVMARSLKSSDYVGMVRAMAPEIAAGRAGEPLMLAEFPSLEHVVVTGKGADLPGMLRFDALIRLAGPAAYRRLPAIAQALDPDDAINIQFTSGTTGTPKGATLSHFNIVNNARASGRALSLGEQDLLCIPVPLYHCFGMVLGVLACTATGAAMVFPGESFDAGETLKALARYRCTALHGVPAMFIAQLEHPDFSRHDLSSLRTGIMAGAPCPTEVMRRVVSEMHMREVTIAYGMTETSPVSFQSDTHDALERRVTTVGRILPHLEAKVIDESGRILPVGKAGELCVRGYAVMRGYWEDTEATAEAIDPAGWMHTGDLATLNGDGYCQIVGRVKDMIIRGGENVYPREIEEFLYTHPKVMEAQVFGVPDERMGEEICAWIVPQPGAALAEEEVRGFCRSRIAHFKIPRYVRIVPQLPSTVTGKAQKFAMRDAMIQELGLARPRR